MSLTAKQRALTRRMLKTLKCKQARADRLTQILSRVLCWRCRQALVRCQCPLVWMEDFYQ